MDVLVVGGGAAGVVTAAHLLPGAGPCTVTVVERAPAVGPGLAYGTTEPLHLLNNYAGRMSALEHDPHHLVRWCNARGIEATPETFVSRATYGAYLTAVFDELAAAEPGRLVRRTDEVVDLDRTPDGYVARTASGAAISADVVVLALGNPPPRRPRGIDVPADRFALDPWDPRLADRVAALPDDARLLLVGTGLTTVDVCAQVAGVRPDVSMTAVSRHGLLPLHHVPDAPGPAHSFDGDVSSLRALLTSIRRSLAAGDDWRCLVESVKAVANDVWRALPVEDRERFTRHAGRYWEISRHRMAPPMASIVDGLLADGRLTLAHPRDVDAATYDLVVNCTGPAPVSSTGWNPLVDNLALKGLLWPGPFGLGVDVDAEGALVDADGLAAEGLFTVGAARRGVEWEVAAVPDLRRQAAQLARHLSAGRLSHAELAIS